jgi:hypothetical protein
MASSAVLAGVDGWFTCDQKHFVRITLNRTGASPTTTLPRSTTQKPPRRAVAAVLSRALNEAFQIEAQPFTLKQQAIARPLYWTQSTGQVISIL